MKLKKIASLMLAGVMVVSTLAGCSGKETDKTDDKEDNEIVATSNAVTYANDALKASVKEYITVKASSTLDGWVKDIATDTSVFKASDIKHTYTNLTAAAGSDGNRNHQNAMRDKLTKKLKDSNVVCVNDINKDFTKAPADKKSQVGSLLYTVSGMLDEKSAVESVVNVVVSGVDCPEQIDNKYNCEYTAEISSVKVTNDSLNGESAWVIAVVITQNVTEAANVQV